MYINYKTIVLEQDLPTKVEKDYVNAKLFTEYSLREEKPRIPFSIQFFH